MSKEISPKWWGTAHRESQWGSWQWDPNLAGDGSYVQHSLLLFFNGIIWVLQVWRKLVLLKFSKLLFKPAALCHSEQLPGRWNLQAPSNLLCVIFIITKLVVMWDLRKCGFPLLESRNIKWRDVLVTQGGGRNGGGAEQHWEGVRSCGQSLEKSQGK